MYRISYHGGYSHEAVVYALRDCGIRHIDTAKRYGCEEALAKAVAESRVPRDDLWITTKLWPYDYGYHSAKQACLASSARLGVDYLGLCHAIGVSNFLISHLEELKDDCGIVPHVNQVEFHPFQQPWDLVRYCQKEGIAFQGFCPLAKGQALSHPLILGLAEKYGRSASQICIGWSIQNGVITIPKSTNPQRIFEICQVFGFQLEEKDMALIGTLHDERHVSWDPTLVK
ncbi:hypothetical protein P4O66_002992 [Electrophorus voltai]|uniref:NADP-dependent oxidoreductase domain-containing protein n=1 Tax=Electrophorus voltai TaxID=2609070 RepID=A0AAD9DL46_9TELE|nr:hypothetical protein P4O66_002992 [Electrophorus voltai]